MRKGFNFKKVSAPQVSGSVSEALVVVSSLNAIARVDEYVGHSTTQESHVIVGTFGASGSGIP